METLKEYRDLRIIINTLIVLLFLGSIQENVRGEMDTEVHCHSQPQQKVAKKSIVKTIQHKSGDVFDCYLINEQPSLRHSSMKGRELKTKPALVPHPAVSNQKPNISSSNYARHSFIGCPSGTVPIRRYDEELLSLSTFDDFLPPSNSSSGSADDNAGYTSFVATRGTVDGQYHGAKSFLGIWGVEGVGPTQKSAALMWIFGDDDSSQETRDVISIGWAVAPHIYGDTQPRLTAYWTAGGTSCLNTRCPGLVQMHETIAFGSTFERVSKYRQYQTYLRVFIRKFNKPWYIFIQVGDNDFDLLGYWDDDVVPGLASNASAVMIGGFVSGPVDEGAPAMGNGHPPNEGVGTSSSVVDVFVIDLQYNFVNPFKLFRRVSESKRSCYSASDPQDDGDKGVSFAYGGPSGCRP